MAKDLAATLAAQGLDRSDLEANRAGRVTEKQMARQAAVRRSGAIGVWGVVAVGMGGGAVGATKFLLNGQPGGAVFMGLLALFLAAMPLAIYYRFRFASPAKVGACKVTLMAN